MLTCDGTNLSALPVVTGSSLYSVSWSNRIAYIDGGQGTLLTYSGVGSSIPLSSILDSEELIGSPLTLLNLDLARVELEKTGLRTCEVRKKTLNTRQYPSFWV